MQPLASLDGQTPSGRLFCLTTRKEYDIVYSQTKLTWTIGRYPTNDLVLGRDTISNFHCNLNFSPGRGIVLKDVSINGTWVNNVLVNDLEDNGLVIRPGDTISLGMDRKDEFMYLSNDTPRPSKIWSRYTCGIQLGSGTFGTVFRCQDVQNGSLYAVKVIDRRRFHLLPGAKQMFEREIESLKALQSTHENIVRLREISDENPMLYLVLEYVSGGNLGRYLRKKNPLPESFAADLTTQICKGVAFIHEHGIAHRDLKPENILLTTRKPFTLKIADFGLAKIIDGGTFLRTRCGTPDYLAPEVIRPSKGGYSEKVDSWSVGVIAFEMLTKKLPFHWDPDPPEDLWSGGSQRIMDFGALSDVNCSTRGIHFIQSLLHEVPTARMNIFRALKQEWLTNPSRDSPPVLRRLAPPPPRTRELPGPESLSPMSLAISVIFFLFAVIWELWQSSGDRLQR